MPEPAWIRAAADLFAASRDMAVLTAEWEAWMAGVDAVIDIRLRNTSHLAGYTKRDDLATPIRDAGVRALFIPIASVHRGPGWFTFTLAAALLVFLGLCEIAAADRLVVNGEALFLDRLHQTSRRPFQIGRECGNGCGAADPEREAKALATPEANQPASKSGR